MNQANWKIEYYGDGEYWSQENLTWERAIDELENTPHEFYAYIVPMELD